SGCALAAGHLGARVRRSAGRGWTRDSLSRRSRRRDALLLALRRRHRPGARRIDELGVPMTDHRDGTTLKDHLARLDEIAERLAHPEVEIGEAMSLYEEAVSRARQAREIVRSAELKVETLPGGGGA